MMNYKKQAKPGFVAQTSSAQISSLCLSWTIALDYSNVYTLFNKYYFSYFVFIIDFFKQKYRCKNY